MADSSIDKKTQQINNMRVDKGKEYQVYQKAQNQLLQIQAAQRQTLSNQRAISNSQAYQMATMKQAAQLAAMNGGQGAYQQRVNPQTQAALAKYGVGKPRFQRQQSSNQQRQGQNVVIHNHNTTNTTNNVDARGAYGGPVQGRALAFKDNNIAFKSWINAAFAKQNEQAQIREKNYEKRESALTRDSNKMMRKLEGVGKTIGERMDPRRITSGMGNQFKALMLMLGLKFIKENIGRILDRVSEMWLGIKFFMKRHLGIDLDKDTSGSLPKGGRAIRSLIRNGKDRTSYALISAFGGDPERGDTIGDVLKRIIIGDDKHPDGLFMRLKDFLELEFKDRAHAVKTYASTKADKISEEIFTLATGDHPLTALSKIIPYLTNIFGIAIGGSKYMETAIIKDIKSDTFNNEVGQSMTNKDSQKNRVSLKTTFKGLAITDANGKDPKAIIASKGKDGSYILTNRGRDLGYELSDSGEIINKNYVDYKENLYKYEALKYKAERAYNDSRVMDNEFIDYDLEKYYRNNDKESIFKNLFKEAGLTRYEVYQGELRFNLLKDMGLVDKNLNYESFLRKFKSDEEYRSSLKEAINNNTTLESERKTQMNRYLTDFQKFNIFGTTHFSIESNKSIIKERLKNSIKRKIRLFPNEAPKEVKATKLRESDIMEIQRGIVTPGYLEGCSEHLDGIFDMEKLYTIQFDGVISPDSLSNTTTATIGASRYLAGQIKRAGGFSKSWSGFIWMNNTIKNLKPDDLIAISPQFLGESIKDKRKLIKDFYPIIRDKSAKESSKDTIKNVLDIILKHNIRFNGGIGHKLVGAAIAYGQTVKKGFQDWWDSPLWHKLLPNSLGLSAFKHFISEFSQDVDLYKNWDNETEGFIGDLRHFIEYNKLLEPVADTIECDKKQFQVKRSAFIVAKLSSFGEKPFKDSNYDFLYKKDTISCYTIIKKDWEEFVTKDLKFDSLEIEENADDINTFAAAFGAQEQANAFLKSNAVIDSRNKRAALEEAQARKRQRVLDNNARESVVTGAVLNAKKGDYRYRGIRSEDNKEKGWKKGEAYILNENTRVAGENGKLVKGHCAAAVTSFYEDAGVNNLRGKFWITNGNSIVPGETNITSAGFVPLEHGHWSYKDIEKLDNPAALGIKPGDIMLAWGKDKNGVLHQHAALWSGEKWISDFEQGSANVYRSLGGLQDAAGDRSIQVFRYGGVGDANLNDDEDSNYSETWEEFKAKAKSGSTKAYEFIRNYTNEAAGKIADSILNRYKKTTWERRDILHDVDSSGLKKDSSIFTDYDVYKSLGGKADFLTWKKNSRYLTGVDVTERGFNGGGRMLDYINGSRNLPDASIYGTKFVGSQGFVSATALENSLKSFLEQDGLTPEVRISKSNGEKLFELNENVKIVLQALNEGNSISGQIRNNLESKGNSGDGKTPVN